MPVLGIDTSCYTTSAAIVDGSALMADRRIPLEVPEGGRGLQQSNALFQHVQNLPKLTDALGEAVRSVKAVAVSSRPRPADGSYMPVFTAGLSAARLLAAALGVPCVETSHQEGHIEAGWFSLQERPRGPFLAFHISGGTTEILRAEPQERGYGLDILGATSDLHAGQVVDRVGVALGLRFPAGPALEKLASESGGEIPALKAGVTGAGCSLSGMESAAQRLIAAGADGAAVARAVFQTLSGVFTAMAAAAADETGLTDLLVIGGVASNGIIRRAMADGLGRRGMRVRFAAQPYSSDNAVGVASIGQQFLG